MRALATTCLAAGLSLALNSPATAKEVCIADLDICLDRDLLRAHFQELVFAPSVHSDNAAVRAALGLGPLARYTGSVDFYVEVQNDAIGAVYNPDWFDDFFDTARGAGFSLKAADPEATQLSGINVVFGSFAYLESIATQYTSTAGMNALQKARMTKMAERLRDTNQRLYGCHYRTLKFGEGGAMQTALVFVEPGDHTERCVNAAMMEAAGFHAYSEEDTAPTILSRKGKQAGQLTDYDKGVLWVMYNGPFAPGQTSDEGMTAFDRFISEQP